MKKTKYAGLALFFLIMSALLSYYGRPYWADTQLSFISLDYLLFFPFLYCVFLALGTGAKYSFIKRILYAAIAAMSFIAFVYIPNPNDLWGKASACLIGMAVTFLVLIVFRQKGSANS